MQMTRVTRFDRDCIFLAVIALFCGCLANMGAPRTSSISKSGNEIVLRSFTGSADGAKPYAPLVNLKGTFSGATSAEGTNDTGTVFGITPDGTEELLHSFGSPEGPIDGAVPYAGLIS
jgi:hypothetical protein